MATGSMGTRPSAQDANYYKVLGTIHNTGSMGTRPSAQPRETGGSLGARPSAPFNFNFLYYAFKWAIMMRAFRGRSNNISYNNRKEKWRYRRSRDNDSKSNRLANRQRREHSLSTINSVNLIKAERSFERRPRLLSTKSFTMSIKNIGVPQRGATIIMSFK